MIAAVVASPANSDEHYPDQFAIRIRGKPRKLGDISGKREYLKKMVGL